ncbi:23S rRNA (uracil(1939)-C(5))-methyltransferase RlmD [Tunturibacter empetritectus]|uniref:23S rRNA (Uracil1939-C5)-methyltransferase n=1 Tax=Tunturiibacter empetritectus TaxID=3069691 RepID=A0A7W8IJD1_9BACT|nr:23S rRNA (uracil(1939)-C(5))-methyltransferase RlmD [Edaphobacter lichenicola]MBB5318219.1 23S rRNA (uracil1939-C5)-methyltransferase [Edaphobacter lichenicola]
MKLQIEKAIYGGAGLAHRTDGESVFVPFVLPGELAEVQIQQHKKNFEEASLLQVLKDSEDRVQPACPHFGECGGCHYQHAQYPAQVKMKASILQEALERAGLSALPEIQSHTAAAWAYRNRMRLRIEEVDSILRAGYNRRGTNEFLAIQECPITVPLLWRAAQSLLQVATENTAVKRWLGNAVEAEFFTTADEKRLQMTVFVRKDQPGLASLCDHMKQFVPELVGAGTSLLKLAGPQRQVQKPRPLESWGAQGLSYPAGNEDYWVSRGAFFQVNRFLIEELVRIVATNRIGQLAWDLYAGVGLFSRALAKTFQQVVAVEAAATDLISSFKGTGRRAVEATTVEFLRQAVVQRERPQLIVVDPPRVGVGAEVCSLLARVSAPELVYVSCDPVTLARDLKMLLDAGYKLEELHLVDLFPQTFHLETIVVLRR